MRSRPMASMWLATVLFVSGRIPAVGQERAKEVAGNPAAVQKVRSGRLTEAKASWWGFDPVDATEALQAALDSGARRVVVENMRRPWIVRPIQVPSDIEIVFEKGAVVEAKRGEFKGSNDSLFNIILRRNVSLIGYGAVLRMHRADYDRPPYAKAEWRHVLNIKSSQNVKIYGLTLAESGGDGIYLGTAKQGATNKNIHIKDVVCDRNYRQGISVITAEDLLIEDTVMKDTAGTPPAAGIDFEPNYAAEKLVRCVMRRCVVEDNAGVGYAFYLPNLTGASEPISIRLEQCIARGSNRSAFAFTLARPNPDGPARGLAEFIDCTFDGGSGPAVTIRSKPAAGCRLRFVRCRFIRPDADRPTTPVIQFLTRANETEDQGNVSFEDCVVEDAVERPLMKFNDWAGGFRLIDVTGTFIVRRNGMETRHVITPKWLDAIRFGQTFKRFPRYETKNKRWAPILEDWSSAGLQLRPFSLRHEATFVLYARRSDRVRFTLRSLQVGKYSGRPIEVTVVTPRGKRLRLGRVPFQQEATLCFEASETGLYRVPVDCGANKVQLVSASHPACVSGESGRIRLIGATGDFYFYVPADTKEFGVRIFGEGQEAVGAAVFDPDGKQVWSRPAITSPEQFVGQPGRVHQGKVWRIQFRRPTTGPMEDFYLQLQGIPPFLSSSPKTLLKPVP
ncbi:MAG TPA: right-handed parallel beta-helix repeat-containing protein [Planctomycetaceae bacterium]|nr:right-handed parallel beta-helix repeat-containing protein [Planctomycetaceae bacterium]